MEEQTVINPVQQPNIPTPPEPKHNSFLTNKLFLITLVIVVLFTIVYAGVYLNLNSQLNKITHSNPTPTIISQLSPTPVDETANWKIYTNTKVGFQFKFPSRYPNPTISGATTYANGDEDNASIFFGLKAKDITSLNDFVILDIRPFLGAMDDLKVKIGAELQKENGSKIINATTKTLKVNGETVIQIIRIIRDAQDVSSQGTKDIEVYLLGHNHIIDILGHNDKELDQILSTFKFLKQSPSATCIPRPACLDAVPRCLIPESENMCPPKPTSSQVVCTQDAKQCLDGSYVSRQPPNCEFAKCP